MKKTNFYLKIFMRSFLYEYIFISFLYELKIMNVIIVYLKNK